MALDPDLTRLHKEIDRLLRTRRPDRYAVHRIDDEDEVSTDDTWLDDLAEAVEHLLPDDEVRRLLARKIVGQREGKATRSTNSFLRKLFQEGQLVLGWWEGEDDPVAVITRIVREGKPVEVREERVALRAMTPDDFRAFATEERRRAGIEFVARVQTCEAADWTADQIIQSGARNFHDWASGVLPPNAGDSASDE